MPSVSKIVNKHWNLLQIDNNIKDTFTERPIVAYKRNKNLKELIGGNVIENNVKVSSKTKNNNVVGRCEPCNGRSDCLCCKQLKNTDTFASDQTGKSYKIFHNVNCKSGNVIYLMECVLCKGKQYIGKCEWSMNRRVNSHRNDVWRAEGPPCDKHFQLAGHNFNDHARFTIIEKI